MNGGPQARLFVCTTCDRYAGTEAGRQRGSAIAAAARSFARDTDQATPVRTVECLMGCPTPCNATLKIASKATLRFSGLQPADVPALFEAAELYAASPDGDIATAQLPPSLQPKLSMRVPAFRTA